MANNPYVNKVQLANGTTLIDISDTTAVASDVASGKYFYNATGAKVQGTITQRDSDDLTASGATVSVPAGYYAEASSKSVATGTAGTPTATKGTVSNHSVTITPSVTNTTGYITGGTKTGTAVTVNVAELESGTKSITENGTGISVSGYSAVDVDVDGSDVFLVEVAESNGVWSPTNCTYAEAKAAYDAGKTVVFQAENGYDVVQGNYNSSQNGFVFSVFIWFDDWAGNAGYTPTSYRWNTSGVTYLAEMTYRDTSSADAQPSEVVEGKIFYNEDGYQVGTMSSVSVGPLTVTQNGTYTAPSGTAYSPVIVDVSSGSTKAEEKDVNFIDYDSTILYSYTASEFANLTALPNNPGHAGLVAQGWNWSLSDAKTYVAKYGKLIVGQMYITQSGATEIDITLTAPNLHPYLQIAPKGTVVIDWGDNTATDTVTGASNRSLKFIDHEYVSAGNYTIKLTVSSGNFAFYTNSSSYRGVLSVKSDVTRSSLYANDITAIRIGENAQIGANAFVYCSSLKSITIPDSVTNVGGSAFQSCYALSSITIPSGITSIGNYAFQSCSALTSITIPSSVTNIGTNVFQSCYVLSSITIPSGVTNVGGSAFQSCYALSSITIPSGVTSIKINVFQNCSSLTSITIPSGVTSIGTNAFNSCSEVQEFHFLPTTPPTLGSTNAFYATSSTCIFYVPTGSLEAYQTATNWSTYASRMVGE